MSDFEMPYFVDGGGNKGYFKDTTAREKIADLKNMLKVEWFSINNNTTPVPAGSYRGFDISFSKPGYMALGVTGLTGSGTGNLSLVEFFITSSASTIRVYYKNDTALDITPTNISVGILFIKQ